MKSLLKDFVLDQDSVLGAVTRSQSLCPLEARGTENKPPPLLLQSGSPQPAPQHGGFSTSGTHP